MELFSELQIIICSIDEHNSLDIIHGAGECLTHPKKF